MIISGRFHLLPKELLVLFMYSDNIYNAKKITMPINWISNSIKNASRSEKLHVPIKQII